VEAIFGQTGPSSQEAEEAVAVQQPPELERRQPFGGAHDGRRR
jgi:hypothetical protein